MRIFNIDFPIQTTAFSNEWLCLDFRFISMRNPKFLWQSNFKINSLFASPSSSSSSSSHCRAPVTCFFPPFFFELNAPFCLRKNPFITKCHISVILIPAASRPFLESLRETFSMRTKTILQFNVCVRFDLLLLLLRHISLYRSHIFHVYIIQCYIQCVRLCERFVCHCCYYYFVYIKKINLSSFARFNFNFLLYFVLFCFIFFFRLYVVSVLFFLFLFINL